MIYKFVLISNEVDGFMREISIDSEAKFIDLHNAILDSVKYSKDGITSFYICDEDWEREQEITLFDMETGMDEDNYTMDDTVISELITDEEQKLMYVFDNIANRAFYIELKEIVPGKDLKEPVCSASTGNPPEQYLIEDFSDLGKGGKNAGSGEIDENFYGDEDFDIDELDADGFSDMNFDDDFNDLR
ncbi:MAG: hypothetical protein MJ009_02750 [Paludibacteraceae bacterium]|nr:hypothetical protein [Paludibacteraceae bacterium]